MSHLPNNPNLNISYDPAQLKEIYFGGGCFWGVEAYLERVKGVAETTVGYANGMTPNPTYKEVCTGVTGYAEAVHVKYDPNILPLGNLLQVYFGLIDPTALNRQGPDKGTQYRSGIYYTDEADYPIIDKAVFKQQAYYDEPIVTETEPLKNYVLAEEYHQKYLEKNPGGYCHISFDSLA
ncbi:MAG: peptide-methionine (S)-S-oxide reductase MsrA [Turicibacter sp.]|nr:peptide-methionine (S)-S-oxide reductase MsrA [Turicibacter sp.]